jgi:hypothetical protein
MLLDSALVHDGGYVPAMLSYAALERDRRASRMPRGGSRARGRSSRATRRSTAHAPTWWAHAAARTGRSAGAGRACRALERALGAGDRRRGARAAEPGAARAATSATAGSRRPSGWRRSTWPRRRPSPPTCATGATRRPRSRTRSGCGPATPRRRSPSSGTGRAQAAELPAPRAAPGRARRRRAAGGGGLRRSGRSPPAARGWNTSAEIAGRAAEIRLLRGDTLGAREAVQPLLDAQGRSTAGDLRLVRVLQSLGHTTEAHRRLDALPPGESPASRAEHAFTRGWIAGWRGDVEAAERLYRESLRLDPYQRAARLALVELLRSGGRDADAEGLLAAGRSLPLPLGPDFARAPRV